MRKVWKLPAYALAAVVPWTGATPAATAPSERIQRFEVPTPNAGPYGITVGPQGTLWFTESTANKVGSLTPDGVFEERRIPFDDTSPRDMTLGPDGSIWWTEAAADLIGQITPAGNMRQYPVPSGFSNPTGIAAAPDGTIWFAECTEVDQLGILFPPLGYIEELVLPAGTRPCYVAAGPDGAMWFTGELGNVIGRVTIDDREVTTWPVPTEQSLPWDIIAGPDGALWFSEIAGHNIGRITTSGQITEFPIPQGFGTVSGLTPGFDGNIWFLQSDSSTISYITPSGEFGPFIPTGELPAAIIAGADGDLWFTERGVTNSVARLRVAPRRTASVIVADAGFIRRTASIPLGGTVRWLFQGPNEHSVTDVLGLFDTGARALGSVESFTYPFAGRFRYVDALAPRRFGTVDVPVHVPTTGQVGEPIPVMWATAAPREGMAFDVQVRTPGSAEWTTWQEGVTIQSADYVPAQSGEYAFRARVGSDRTRSAWSPEVTVQVSP